MALTVAYLGPAGTHTEEALIASAAEEVRREPRATLHETIMAVQLGETDRAVVPIENSLEGGVAATLDALAGDADRVRIVAEVVHPIHHQLITRPGVSLQEISGVVSFPHATGQCDSFLRKQLPRAEWLPASSTAEAVRLVSQSAEPLAALGSSLAAELYGCRVLARDVEDRPDNLTRFVWLAPGAQVDAGPHPESKTSIVFWGFNDASPGALVAVLQELSDRGINMTRIESRPRRVRLGHYMFFADLDGHAADPRVADALDGLAARVQTLRLLGSYPSRPGRPII
ncbi:MAG: prephenate dehydratase [Thermoleophilaceae bacterium]|nr:prephenate dehydratase [Thermoleophilaceae bacterium]